MIDDAAHTIESAGGNASILLQHPGVPDIKLWDGPLHADLGKKDNVGDPLFSLPMAKFHANVLGFEALGTPTAVLGDESVSIPLALKLPAYLGVTGSATLAANMAEGLVRPRSTSRSPTSSSPASSCAAHRSTGPGPEDQWTGTGELEMQPGAGAAGLDVHGAQIAFDHGDFTSGGFTTAPYPGTPIYHNAYLENLGAAFNLHPPPSLTGNAEIGAVAHGGGVYSLEATRPPADQLRQSLDDERRRRRRDLRRPADQRPRHLHHRRDLPRDRHPRLRRGRPRRSAAPSTRPPNLAAGTTSGTIAGGFSFLGQSVEQSLPFNDTGFGYCKEVGVSRVLGRLRLQVEGRRRTLRHRLRRSPRLLRRPLTRGVVLPAPMLRRWPTFP